MSRHRNVFGRGPSTLLSGRHGRLSSYIAADEVETTVRGGHAVDDGDAVASQRDGRSVLAALTNWRRRRDSQRQAPGGEHGSRNGCVAWNQISDNTSLQWTVTTTTALVTTLSTMSTTVNFRRIFHSRLKTHFFHKSFPSFLHSLSGSIGTAFTELVPLPE